MIKTFVAVFDGEVLIPEEPLAIPPHSRVRISLRTASSLKLNGPSPEAILELATSIYAGLSEEDIAEIEQIALRRGSAVEPDESLE
jgi:hypothetical protein